RNGEAGDALDEGGNPVSVAEEGGGGAEPCESEKENARFGEGLQDGVVADFFLGLQFGGEFSGEPVAFVGRKPARFGGPVGKVEKRDDAEDDGRDSFKDKEPAPSGELQPMDAEKRPGERRAQQRGRGNGGVKAGDGAAAFLLAKPV